MQSVNLAKYVGTFLDNGVDDLEIILELDDKHLEQMSIPMGHKLKIMKRIKDIRRDRGMEVPESRQGNAQSQRGDTATSSLDKPDVYAARRPPVLNKPPPRTDLDELPDPTNGSYTNGSMSYDTLQKNSA